MVTFTETSAELIARLQTELTAARAEVTKLMEALEPWHKLHGELKEGNLILFLDRVSNEWLTAEYVEHAARVYEQVKEKI